MQRAHTLPVQTLVLNSSTGGQIYGWCGYSTNVSPASAAVELTNERYFLWASRR